MLPKFANIGQHPVYLIHPNASASAASIPTVSRNRTVSGAPIRHIGQRNLFDQPGISFRGSGFAGGEAAGSGPRAARSAFM